jgi:hypothetical protein
MLRFTQSSTHSSKTLTSGQVPFPCDLAAQRMLEAVLQDALDQSCSSQALTATRIQFSGYEVTCFDQRVRLTFCGEV